MGDKRCPDCGMLMVKRYGRTDLGLGARRYSWWCRCGAEETGGIEPLPTGEELLERMWVQKNTSQKGVAGRIARHRIEGRPI